MTSGCLQKHDCCMSSEEELLQKAAAKMTEIRACISSRVQLELNDAYSSKIYHAAKGEATASFSEIAEEFHKDSKRISQ